jgi:hypothetical protein
VNEPCLRRLLSDPEGLTPLETDAAHGNWTS